MNPVVGVCSLFKPFARKHVHDRSFAGVFFSGFSDVCQCPVNAAVCCLHRNAFERLFVRADHAGCD